MLACILGTAMISLVPAGPGMALSICLHGVCLPGQGQQDLWGSVLGIEIMQRAETEKERGLRGPQEV